MISLSEGPLNARSVYSKASGEKILRGKTIRAEKGGSQPGSLLLPPRCIFSRSPVPKLPYTRCISCSVRPCYSARPMLTSYTSSTKAQGWESPCPQPGISVASNGNSERPPLAAETRRDAFQPAPGHQNSQPVVEGCTFIQAGDGLIYHPGGQQQGFWLLWYGHCIRRGGDCPGLQFHTCLCREICLRENPACWPF